MPAPTSRHRRGRGSPAPGRALAKSDTAAPTGRPQARLHKQPPITRLLSSRPTLQGSRPTLQGSRPVPRAPSPGRGPPFWLFLPRVLPVLYSDPLPPSQPGAPHPKSPFQAQIPDPDPGSLLSRPRPHTRLPPSGPGTGAPALSPLPSHAARRLLTSLAAAAVLAGLWAQRSPGARRLAGARSQPRRSGLKRLLVARGALLVASGAPRSSKDVISQPGASNTMSSRSLVSPCSAVRRTGRSTGDRRWNGTDHARGRHFVTRICPSKPI